MDEVEARARQRTEAANVAGVLRDLGLKEDDMEHNKSVSYFRFQTDDSIPWGTQYINFEWEASRLVQPVSFFPINPGLKARVTEGRGGVGPRPSVRRGPTPG